MRLHPLISSGLILVILAAAAPTLRADDKATEDQYLALAAQRTKAELASRKAQQTFDQARGGWRDATGSVDELHQKIYASFANAVRTEQAKAEGDRNQTLIDELNGQLQQVEQDWQTYARERENKGVAYQLLANIAQNIHNVFDNLVQDERAWKDAGMDLTVLGANYDLITRSMDDVAGKGQTLIDDMKTRQTDWEAKLAAATKATAPAPAPAPAAAPAK